ncbi:MAG: hypothetical protein AAFV93_19650 [Chloroflexota bacterium]
MMIPYQALDQFYFDEFVANLHPTLQTLAVDKHLLRHELDAEPLMTIKGLYQEQYLYMPYLLVDFFPINDTQLSIVGQAWILRIIDFVMTDNIIDRQVPDNPLIVLFHQHLRTQSDQLFHQVIGDNRAFWAHYYQVNHALNNANALEVYCVDQHRQPYTLDVMTEIYEARSALLGIVIHVMARLTDRLDEIEPFLQYYQKIALADQLLDDAADWRDDFRDGRYTLPIVKALQAENIPFDKAHTLSEADYQIMITRHSILQLMNHLAIGQYEEVHHMLEQLNALDSALAKFLQGRMDVAEHSMRRYNAIGLLQGFRNLLTE